eukprot:375389-Hanusia_phi.AAC.1
MTVLSVTKARGFYFRKSEDMPGGRCGAGTQGIAAQCLLILLIVIGVSAHQQKSPQEELKAKITAIHALSQTYLKKVPQGVVAASQKRPAVHGHNLAGMQAVSNKAGLDLNHGIKLASAAPANQNSKDPRMNNGKFDWLLKETSPLYTAAKKAVSVAAHKLRLNVPNKPKGALELQASNGTDVNSTEASSQGQRSIQSGEGVSDDITSEFKMTKKNELYFFITWIVVLFLVIGVLLLCVVYARKMLGAEGQKVPPSNVNYAVQAKNGLGAPGYGAAGRIH